MFHVGGPNGITTYQHKLARIKQGNWDIFEVGPVVDCGYAAYVRDDNFLLQVVSPKLLRAYIVNITAGSPVRTQMDLWESTDGARTWTRQKPLFSSTGYPAEYVLIAPKLVLDARPDAQLVFGQTKRYLYGNSGFVKREGPE